MVTSLADVAIVANPMVSYFGPANPRVAGGEPGGWPGRVARGGDSSLSQQIAQAFSA